MEIQLRPRQTLGSSVHQTNAGWRLDLPAGQSRSYHLAQLDDYGSLSRNRFFHTPPMTFRLCARVSGADLPGTWGFGLWNDPFGLSLGFGGKPGRLPTLPQAAWFMHASLPNWLSLRDDPEKVPANGFFAGTFRSLRIPSFLFTPVLPVLPLFIIRPISRFFRRQATRLLHQDACRVDLDVTQWHEYSIQWMSESCLFSVDGNNILHTSCSPLSPLGLVVWIDNQFAAWTREGRLSYGTLETPAAWLDIKKVFIHMV
jgi:hypothetical protein